MSADRRSFAGYRKETLELLPSRHSPSPSFDEDDFLEIELPLEVSFGYRRDLVDFLGVQLAETGESAYATGNLKSDLSGATAEDGLVTQALSMPDVIKVLAAGAQVGASLLDNPLVKVLERFLELHEIEASTGWIDENDLILKSKYRLATRYDLNVEALALVDVEVTGDRRGSVKFSDADGIHYGVSYESSKGGLEATRFRRSTPASR